MAYDREMFLSTLQILLTYNKLSDVRLCIDLLLWSLLSSLYLCVPVENKIMVKSLPNNKILTLYYTIPTFNNPLKEVL